MESRTDRADTLYPAFAEIFNAHENTLDGAIALFRNYCGSDYLYLGDFFSPNKHNKTIRNFLDNYQAPQEQEASYINLENFVKNKLPIMNFLTSLKEDALNTITTTLNREGGIATRVSYLQIKFGLNTIDLDKVCLYLAENAEDTTQYLI